MTRPMDLSGLEYTGNNLSIGFVAQVLIALMIYIFGKEPCASITQREMGTARMG